VRGTENPTIREQIAMERVNKVQITVPPMSNLSGKMRHGRPTGSSGAGSKRNRKESRRDGKENDRGRSYRKERKRGETDPSKWD
jgi:hypothetical protein